MSRRIQQWREMRIVTMREIAEASQWISKILPIAINENTYEEIAAGWHNDNILIRLLAEELAEDYIRIRQSK